jgi:putative ABC transport system permease protein
MHIEDNLRAGMTPEEARRDALIRLGGLESVKQAYRERRGVPGLETMIQDLRYGARMLRKNPGFSLVAVLTLALGIGSATTIFSVLYNVLFDPFPYQDANRVVALRIRNLNAPQHRGWNAFMTPEVLDYQEQSQVFEDVIATCYEDVLYTTAEGTESLGCGLLSGNTFSFLGVPAAVGRTLTPEDGKPGAPPVFVMSFKMWRKYFNLDAGILGRTFTLNGVPTTLVGIMPGRFALGDNDLYKPVVLDRAKVNERHFMLHARLKPGVTVQQAEAELSVIAQRIFKVYPRNYPPDGRYVVKLVSWVDEILGSFRKTLYLLWAAVGLLLLIACSNVANMLLARASVREKEMAIRASVGASRTRLVRQLLLESLLLALIGMAVGCVFAHVGVKALVSAMPGGAIPAETVIRLNVPVLLFSVGLAGVTAVLFGLVPALHTARRDLVEPLKDARKGGGVGFRHNKLRPALVVLEVALSLVLLAGAGLLMRSFVRLTTMDLGFNPDHILVSWLSVPDGTSQTRRQFYGQLLPRLQALPGVVSVTTFVSLAPNGIWTDIEIPGKERTQAGWDVIIELCSEGYFQTLGWRLLRGRPFTGVEVNDGRKVVVVNQTFVNSYFGTEDPLGRQVRFNRLETLAEQRGEKATFEIVGVVADAKNRGIGESPGPEAFLPYTAMGGVGEPGIMLRTIGDPRALINTVRHEIRALNRNVLLSGQDSLAGIRRQYYYAGPRFRLFVVGVFASVALVLVALGVYSVIAYTVSRQTHEIGIRMALGAQPGNVLWLVLRGGLQPALIGIVVGVSAALALTRVIASWLFEVKPTDPVTLVGVSLLLVAISLIACWLPARRATKVDPMTALRYE